jgi:HAE1 family hydrophobic/amphiphilic exporter-1
MQKLAEICVQRPVFATVLILVLAVFGISSYQRLGVDRFPKVDIPVITVTTVLPGAAPDEIETEVTEKIEEAVNTVSGIDELRSTSVEGVSQVFISFELDKDVDVASQEVRDKINAILNDLPEDIEQPLIEKMETDSIPVLTVVVSGTGSIREITEYADKTLRRRLESVAGVGKVSLIGGQKRQINVLLDPLKLKSFNLTVTDVQRALARQNLQVPGGTIKQGEREFTVRTLGRVSRPEELGLIAVANVGGHTITINELGTVEDGSEEPESLAQYNETQAVLLSVRKQSGTNTVEVVHNLKQRLEDLKPTLPAGYQTAVARDQSLFIEGATEAVKEHLVLGSILAAVIVFIFLANGRTTLIAALAIPTSVIGTFTIINMMGYTLNLISLLALTLSVGIVIDDAIVVLENIFRFIEEKNYPPFEAAIAATREIGLAVLSITLSLVAVFMPIAMMSGVVGRFMSGFGITMSGAIVISMLVSFTLTPMLAARWLKRPNGKKNGNGNGNGKGPLEEHSIEDVQSEHAHSSSKKSGFYHLIEVVYLALLRFSMRHRWVVVLVAAGCMAAIPVLLPRIPKNFLPEDDESQFQVDVRAPEGTSLEATQLAVARIARDIRSLNGVEYTIASTADTEQRIANRGSIYVRLTDTSTRDFTQLQIMNFIRENLLSRYADQDLRIRVSLIAAISGGGMSNAAVQYLLAGPDMEKLTTYSNHLVEVLRKTPGATDIDTSLVIGKPELGVTIDRAKAADLGVSVADVASALRLLIAGDKVSDYYEKGEQYEIRVRAQADRRTTIAHLQDMTVPSTKVGSVTLADIVKVKEGTGPSQFDRMNRRRQVTILANTAPGASQQALIDALENAAKELNMGPEYGTALAGQSREMGKAFRGFFLAFLMAFVFIYLVLAAQFESWLHPITILLSLPLTIPFLLLSLLLFGESLNMFSLLGVMVLFAVVKKNAILQIDHTNQLRAKGIPRNDAIIAANLDRLRPILMTTIAFVAGMFPLLLSKGTGAATNRTISSVVVGGQTLSLLLTLLATPVAYSYFDDLANARIWKWLGLVKKTETADATKTPVPDALTAEDATE